jgi:hypothetical protein
MQIAADLPQAELLLLHLLLLLCHLVQVKALRSKRPQPRACVKAVLP